MKMSRVNGIAIFSPSPSLALDLGLFLFHSFGLTVCFFCLYDHFDARRMKSFRFRILDIHAHKFINYDKKKY